MGLSLRKIAVSDRDVQCRRRVAVNCEVSYWREEFDSDGRVSQMAYGKQKRKPDFGTSKKEHLVSDYCRVNPCRGYVYGG